MTFEQIGYFLALVEEGSFNRAARRCGISQPSLSNAIKALEAALGAPLFERTVAGSELTAFGKAMRPHLARLHHDRLRALEFAHACSPNGSLIARRDLPRLQTWPEPAGGVGRPSRRIDTLVLAALMACAAIATTGHAWAGENRAGEHDVQAAIRDMLPAPFRCSRTTEPALYCRHDDTANPSVVLELVSGAEGPSASLTYDYDDARRHEFFAIMRRFFIRLGVSADAFDECTSRSQWQPDRRSANDHQVLCHRVEFGDRVTYEIFATAADEAPRLAHARDAQ